MQCLFFIWRPGHHRSFEELQGLGKGVIGDSKFKNSNVHMDHTLTSSSEQQMRGGFFFIRTHWAKLLSS